MKEINFIQKVVQKVLQPYNSRNIKNRPIPARVVLQIAIGIIFFLALLAGYFHAQYQAENRKYRRLEDMYVRVRSQLGREVMQDLIDASYK